MFWKKRSNLLFLFFLLSLPNLANAQLGSFKTFIFLDSNKSKELSWVRVSEKKEDYKFEWDPLKPLAKNFLKTKVYNQLKGKVFEGWISFSDIESANLKILLSEESLNILITSNKLSAKKQFLSLADRESEKREEVTPSAFFSTYLNLRFNQMFGSLNQSSTPNLNNQEFRGSLEHVLNLGGVVFENQFNYTELRMNPELVDEWNRDYTRLIYDDVDRMVRYTAGDFLHPISNYQTFFQGAGFSVSRAFDINPLFLRSNFRKSEIYLQQPSIVEVYVNGTLQERKLFQKGSLNISDFPFYNGENEVRVKVIDDFGRTEETSFSALHDIALLAPGVSDYTFNIGFLRKHNPEYTLGVSEDGYESEKWVSTNFYRRGVKENLVLGFNAQTTYQNEWLYGVESIIGSKLGISALSLSQSVDSEQSVGYAYRLEHQSNVLTNGKFNDVRFNLSAEYKSRFFSPPEDNLNPNRLEPNEWSVVGSLGQNFIRTLRGSFGVNHISSYSRETRNYITTNFGWSPLRNWNFNVNSKVNVEDTTDTTVFLSLNWFAPINRQQYVATFRPIDRRFSSDYSIDPLNTDQTLRTRAGVDVTDSSNSYRAIAAYQNQRIDLQVDHTNTQSRDFDSTSSATNIRGGIALAMASDVFSIVRPVNNSFALVKVKDKPNSKPIALNRYRNHQRGEVNVYGPAAVSDLTPYFKDYITLDTNQLPPGYSMDKTSFTFKPRFKSGVALKTAVSGTGSIKGVLLNFKGKPIALSTGELITLTYPKKSKLFFTDESGDFFIEDVEAGEYRIKLKGSSKVGVKVTVDKNEVGIVDIGNVLYPTNEDL